MRWLRCIEGSWKARLEDSVQILVARVDRALVSKADYANF